MSAGHTTWTADLTDFGIMDSMTTYVTVDDGYETVVRIPANRPDWQDRARLIAAALDLLEVARMVVEASDLAGFSGPLGDAARAALAKARGDDTLTRATSALNDETNEMVAVSKGRLG